MNSSFIIESFRSNSCFLSYVDKLEFSKYLSSQGYILKPCKGTYVP